MRALLALALLLATAPASAQSSRDAFSCSAEAAAGGLQAVTSRELDRRGALRKGTTSVRLPLTGVTGSLDAEWDVRQGLPAVALGNYSFQLPPAADATWQLVGLSKPIRAKAGVLAINGKQLRPLLVSGASVQLALVTRLGEVRGRATLDRTIFDSAVDLARQADARALAKASDYRRQCEPTKVITAA